MNLKPQSQGILNHCKRKSPVDCILPDDLLPPTRKNASVASLTMKSKARHAPLFTKVKQELEFIPAQLNVLEYWQEKAVFNHEDILKRYGHKASRTNMANWVIRLEDGKTAQSDKWMWVTRGGPLGPPCVLFEYDPSPAGLIPERLLHGFSGTMQANGYAGYNLVCKNQNLTRIGCWDHVHRIFISCI
jgi:transposase